MNRYRDIKTWAKQVIHHNTKAIIGMFFVYSSVALTAKVLVTALLYAIKLAVPLPGLHSTECNTFVSWLVVWLTTPLLVGCLGQCNHLIDTLKDEQYISSRVQIAEIFMPYRNGTLLCKSLIIGFVIEASSFIPTLLMSVGLNRYQDAVTTHDLDQIGSAMGLRLLFLLLSLAPMILIVYLWPASFLLAEQSELPAGKTLKNACQLIRGNFWRTIGFELSFILWILLYLIINLVLDRIFKGIFHGFSYAALHQFLLMFSSTFLMGVGIYLTPYLYLSRIFYLRDLANYKKTHGLM